MPREIDLSKLSVAEKDALILSLLPLAGQLQDALARIVDLEARLARYEKPPTNGFRSEWGAHTYAAFRSVVSTAKANGSPVLEDLRRVLASA